MAISNGGIIGPDNIPTGKLGTASGVWKLNDATDYIEQGLWPVATGLSVPNSCRFNGTNDSLVRTPSSNGSFVINTWSFWVKRSNLGSDIVLFSSYVSGSNVFQIRFRSTDTLEVSYYTGVWDFQIATSRLFRDVSAFYNIVIVQNAGAGTSTDRLQVWVNGVRETSFGTTNFPALDEGSNVINSTGATQNIGYTGGSSEYFGGYMSEVVHIDGTAYSADSFGEFDTITPTNWKPIDVSGLTFGTNGFYLPFQNSGALGQDDSGEGNNLTVNNLTSIDQATDSPTNNYATWNPLDNFVGEGTTSEGNIRYTTGSTNQAPIPATIGVSSGKWYWEVKFVSDTGGYAMIGIASSQTTANNELGHNSTDYAYVSGTGQYRNNDGYTSYGNTYAAGDIIGVALDMDNNKLYFSKNGTFQNSGDPTSGATGTGAISITASASTSLGNYFPALSDFGSNTVVFDGNFGSPPFAISSGNTDANSFGDFEYAVPSGFYALNTKNLTLYG